MVHSFKYVCYPQSRFRITSHCTGFLFLFFGKGATPNCSINLPISCSVVYLSISLHITKSCLHPYLPPGSSSSRRWQISISTKTKQVFFAKGLEKWNSALHVGCFNFFSKNCKFYRFV